MSIAGLAGSMVEKSKNPLLQCFGRTQILAYVSLEPFTYIQLWCFQIAQAFDRAERAEEEAKQAAPATAPHWKSGRLVIEKRQRCLEVKNAKASLLFFKTSLGYWEPILGYSGCQSIIELGSMQFLGKFVDRGCQLECLGDSSFTPLQDTPDISWSCLHASKSGHQVLGISFSFLYFPAPIYHDWSHRWSSTDLFCLLHFITMIVSLHGIGTRTHNNQLQKVFDNDMSVLNTQATESQFVYHCSSGQGCFGRWSCLALYRV